MFYKKEYYMMRILCLFVFVLCNMGAFSQVVFQNDEVKVSVLKDKTYVFETWGLYNHVFTGR